MPYSSIKVCNENEQTTYLAGEDFEGLVAIESGEDSRYK